MCIYWRIAGDHLRIEFEADIDRREIEAAIRNLKSVKSAVYVTDLTSG